MAGIKRNDKVSKKGMYIIGAVVLIAIAIIVGVVIMNQSKTNNVGSRGSNAVAQVDGGSSRYDGSTIEIDDRVKKQTELYREGRKQDASENESTYIAPIPKDKDIVRANVVDADRASLFEDIPCVDTEYDADGYHCETGLDKNGYDRDGYDEFGFDKNGCNRAGMNLAGEPCGEDDVPKTFIANNDVKKQQCFDDLCPELADLLRGLKDKTISSGSSAGFGDAMGFDGQGFNASGFDKMGYNREGFDASGYDKFGCDKKGLNKNGNPCPSYGADGFDEEGFDRHGFDDSGYNRQGFNKFGCDEEGLDINGNPCENKFGADGFDAEGFNANG